MHIGAIGPFKPITTTTNSTMQLSTEPAMRGRVMAIFLAIALGGRPLGAPVVGWVVDTFGPRWALGVAAAAGLRRRSSGCGIWWGIGS
jgi:MFS family permease